MATILIVACPHDPSTRYGYHYLKKVTPLLARYGHKIVLLKTAVLTQFQKALLKYDPDFVILNGHGGEKGVTGCNYHVILGIPSWDRDLNVKIERGNPEWMRGRIVYLFTCNTGKELAPSLITYGAQAVAAFQDAYIFLAENSGDHEAYPFFDAALEFAMSLAEGRAAGEAFTLMKQTFFYYLKEAEKRDDTLKAKYLWHNYVNCVFYGNPYARLI